MNTIKEINQALAYFEDLLDSRPAFDTIKLRKVDKHLCKLRAQGYSDKSAKFQECFKRYETDFDSHRIDILLDYLGEEVELEGTVVLTDFGRDRNMARISPAFINGERTQHVHINNQLLKDAEKDGRKIKLKAGIYVYTRKNGSKGISIGLAQNAKRSFNKTYKA